MRTDGSSAGAADIVDLIGAPRVTNPGSSQVLFNDEDPAMGRIEVQVSCWTASESTE